MAAGGDPSRRPGHRRLAVSCALLPCLTGPLAPTPAAARAAYTIAEQPLGGALLELARQSGRDVLFRPELVRGCRAAPLSGETDFEAALAHLISGCHLRYRLGDGGAIELERAPVPTTVAIPAVAPAPGQLPEVLIVRAAHHDAPPGEIAATALTDSLTAAELRERADRTLAEGLGRLAGVNVLVTSLQGDLGGIDRAARGEGQFAAVRGLDSAYAVTRLDGVSVAQSMPYSRAVQLSLLPPWPWTGWN
ncbi:STN domain-containing protein [Nitrospirillum sp. BR 11828]|uniref:STN domain-containing protein n=1 Tax=Nitrospirillum sp. BR 11828 TaxID=3104325 RepID=UPI002ACA2CEC|nr:TonB-dependent receptor plug domain-containing protein [Nitrospirillum sp. BR 11828]MDZ5649794.1 TonB-dependent receptor plug domain-containing protein [Nitrospirillum sp. BR 11828]